MMKQSDDDAIEEVPSGRNTAEGTERLQALVDAESVSDFEENLTQCVLEMGVLPEGSGREQAALSLWLALSADPSKPQSHEIGYGIQLEGVYKALSENEIVKNFSVYDNAKYRCLVAPLLSPEYGRKAYAKISANAIDFRGFHSRSSTKMRLTPPQYETFLSLHELALKQLNFNDQFLNPSSGEVFHTMITGVSKELADEQKWWEKNKEKADNRVVVRDKSWIPSSGKYKNPTGRVLIKINSNEDRALCAIISKAGVDAEYSMGDGPQGLINKKKFAYPEDILSKEKEGKEKGKEKASIRPSKKALATVPSLSDEMGESLEKIKELLEDGEDLSLEKKGNIQEACDQVITLAKAELYDQEYRDFSYRFSQALLNAQARGSRAPWEVMNGISRAAYTMGAELRQEIFAPIINAISADLGGNESALLKGRFKRLPEDLSGAKKAAEITPMDPETFLNGFQEKYFVGNQPLSEMISVRNSNFLLSLSKLRFPNDKKVIEYPLFPKFKSAKEMSLGEEGKKSKLRCSPNDQSIVYKILQKSLNNGDVSPEQVQRMVEGKVNEEDFGERKFPWQEIFASRPAVTRIYFENKIPTEKYLPDAEIFPWRVFRGRGLQIGIRLPAALSVQKDDAAFAAIPAFAELADKHGGCLMFQPDKKNADKVFILDAQGKKIRNRQPLNISAGSTDPLECLVRDRMPLLLDEQQKLFTRQVKRYFRDPSNKILDKGKQREAGVRDPLNAKELPVNLEVLKDGVVGPSVVSVQPPLQAGSERGMTDPFAGPLSYPPSSNPQPANSTGAGWGEIDDRLTDLDGGASWNSQAPPKPNPLGNFSTKRGR